MTILIEGLDLAGKSTARRGLERFIQNRGFELRSGRNSLCAGNRLAEAADAMRRDPNRDIRKTSELFLRAHRWDARHFRPPHTGTVHLQDSCWMRTLAFARFSGDSEGAAKLEREAHGFPRFDAVFFLTASLEERRKRLLNREREEPEANDSGDAWVNTRPEDFVRLESALLQVAGEFSNPIEIDTTSLEPRVVQECVVKAMGALLDSPRKCH